MNNSVILWENPSPNNTVSTLIATLSDDPSNFKQIGVRYKRANNHGNDDFIEILYRSEDFEQLSWSSQHFVGCLACYTSGVYIRVFDYSSSGNSVSFDLCYEQTAHKREDSGNIPLKIVGYK